MREIFASKELCNSKLRIFALAEGFDIIRNGGDITANLAWRFWCYYHKSTTYNQRQLENQIKKNKEEKIINKY